MPRRRKEQVKVPRLLTRNKKIKKKRVVREKEDSLDLCLLCDCTGSMSMWIQTAKNTLESIINSIKAKNPGLKVRVAFIAYRDYSDGPKRFEI